jgi:hypothetical protein
VGGQTGIFTMKQHHDLSAELGRSQPIQVMSKIRMISEASSAWKVSSPVTGAEHRHAEGRILARRHYGRIPGLLGQVNHPLQQGIESGAR